MGTTRPRRRFVVTVETVSYMEVTARDVANARQVAERRLPTEYGTGIGRTSTITDITDTGDMA